MFRVNSHIYGKGCLQTQIWKNKIAWFASFRWLCFSSNSLIRQYFELWILLISTDQLGIEREREAAGGGEPGNLIYFFRSGFVNTLCHDYESILWVHYPSREFTLNSLSISRIEFDFTMNTPGVSQIQEFLATINSPWCVTTSPCQITAFLTKSLSFCLIIALILLFFSRIHYES